MLTLSIVVFTFPFTSERHGFSLLVPLLLFAGRVRERKHCLMIVERSIFIKEVIQE